MRQLWYPIWLTIDVVLLVVPSRMGMMTVPIYLPMNASVSD